MTLVIDVAAGLGVDAAAEGLVRLVVDLAASDVDQLLRDLKRINESESRIFRQGGRAWVAPRWRSVVCAAAAGSISGRVATHGFSHGPESLFAAGPWAREYSTAQAASILGCTAQNVRWACRHGVLRARQVPGGRRQWVLEAEAVEARAAARGRLVGADVPLGQPTASGR